MGRVRLTEHRFRKMLHDLKENFTPKMEVITTKYTLNCLFHVTKKHRKKKIKILLLKAPKGQQINIKLSL